MLGREAAKPTRGTAISRDGSAGCLISNENLTDLFVNRNT
jgi:hypothetical protein